MIIYTDSSYNDKHGVAGIGCLIIDGEKCRIYSNWIKIEKVKAHTGHYQFSAINNAMADLLTKEGVVKFLATLPNVNHKTRGGR